MYLKTNLPPAETETRADPFTLPALIAWLRTKNPEEAYSYINARRCLLTQYFTFAGVPIDSQFFYTDFAGNRIDSETRPDLFHVARGNTFNQDWAFGKALKRAEAML